MPGNISQSVTFRPSLCSPLCSPKTLHGRNLLPCSSSSCALCPFRRGCPLKNITQQDCPMWVTRHSRGRCDSSPERRAVCLLEGTRLPPLTQTCPSAASLSCTKLAPALLCSICQKRLCALVVYVPACNLQNDQGKQVGGD